MATPTPTPTLTPPSISRELEGELAVVADIVTWLATHWVVPVAIGAWIGLLYGWKRLREYYAQRGRALAPLGMITRNVLRFALREDVRPLVTRPAWLAERCHKITARHFYLATAALTVVAVATGWFNPLYPAVPLVLVLWARAAQVFRVRRAVMMQMFEVAAAECRYPKGANLTPWVWINIQRWEDLVRPGTTIVSFPAAYQSEDPKVREKFERQFSGTVSDEHAWTYQWESARNRVICQPVSFLPTLAPYPGPGEKWNEFVLGVAGEDKLAVWDVSTFPHALICGPTGTGKQLPLSTPIPTPSGWTTVGEISVGDVVFDRHGRPTRVVGLSPIRTPSVAYEVVFSDGSTVRADAEHLWWTEIRHPDTAAGGCGRRGCRPLLEGEVVERLRHAAQAADGSSEISIAEVAALAGWDTTPEWVRHVAAQVGPVAEVQPVTVAHKDTGGGPRMRAGAPVATYPARALLTRVAELGQQHCHHQPVPPGMGVRTTEEIRATLATPDGKPQHLIPAAGPLLLPEVNLPVAPYTFGVWLAAGWASPLPGGQVEREIADAVSGDGWRLATHTNSDTGQRAWTFTDPSGGLLDPHRLGAGEGDRRLERIPLVYLRAAVPQRQALLAGLVDVLGDVTPSGAVEVLVPSRHLAGDIRQLVVSLGRIATIRPHTSNGWVVSWHCPTSPFRCRQKSAAHAGRGTYRPEQDGARWIVEIRPVEPEPMRCLMVDSPDRSFLVGGELIPTHNSVLQRIILFHALAHRDTWRIIGVDPKMVEMGWLRKYHPSVLDIALSLEDGVEAIQRARDEMMRRYDEMQTQGVNHFLQLPNPPPALLCMVDEAYNFLAPEGIKSEEGKERDALHARAAILLGEIARLGRAAGVHLVLATQRPDATVIKGELKNNLDCRIAAGRMDTTPSLMVLDSEAATRLPPIKGRGIIRLGGNLTTFQAFFAEQDWFDQWQEDREVQAPRPVHDSEDPPASGEEAAPPKDDSADPPEHARSLDTLLVSGIHRLRVVLSATITAIKTRTAQPHQARPRTGKMPASSPPVEQHTPRHPVNLPPRSPAEQDPDGGGQTPSPEVSLPTAASPAPTPAQPGTSPTPGSPPPTREQGAPVTQPPTGGAPAGRLPTQPPRVPHLPTPPPVSPRLPTRPPQAASGPTPAPGEGIPHPGSPPVPSAPSSAGAAQASGKKADPFATAGVGGASPAAPSPHQSPARGVDPPPARAQQRRLPTRPPQTGAPQPADAPPTDSTSS